MASSTKQAKRYNIGILTEFFINAETKKEALDQAFRNLYGTNFACASITHVNVTGVDGKWKMLSKERDWEDDE